MEIFFSNPYFNIVTFSLALLVFAFGYGAYSFTQEAKKKT